MTDPKFIIKHEVNESNYGKFIIEPLDQGYGQTLGNSLRRVLLTSLPGSAIISVKISGVKHQFSTVKGLKEDVVELIMKLKHVRLIINGDDEVSLSLTKKGKGEITANDIEAPAGVTVVNKDLVLGELSDKTSEIDIILKAKRGYGFETADERNIDEIGVIPLDALYSPIIRVNYKVEETRVGRMTNLDRLVMEIWSDGTINPEEALKNAATILVSYFRQVIEPSVMPIEEKVEKVEISDELLKTRIEELDIPTRIVNALSNGGVETIAQLLETPRSDLMKIKNLGSKSLSIVEGKLKEKGIIINN